MKKYILNNELPEINTLEDLDCYFGYFNFVTQNEYAENWIDETISLFLEIEMEIDYYDLDLDFDETLEILIAYYTDDYIEYMVGSLDDQIDCYNENTDVDIHIIYNFEEQTYIPHREDGPAIECYDGEEDRYFLNGVEYTEKEYVSKMRKEKLKEILN